MIVRAKFLFISLCILIIGGAVFIWNNYYNLSGTYISQDDNSVHAIRLVQTKDGKLSGQFEAVILTPDGHVKDVGAAIEGTTDNNNLNLSFNFIPLLPVPVTAFGNHDRNSITLTIGIFGEPPKTRVYSSSDLNAFQSASDNLREKSKQILSEKQLDDERAKNEQKKKDFIANTEKLIQEMQETNAKIENDLNRFPNIEKKYNDITNKVQAYHDKAQQVARSGNQYAVGQIEYVMNQGRYATDQVHYQVQSLDNNFNTKMATLMQTVASYENACKTINSTSLTSVNACQQFLDTMTLFKTKVEAMSLGLKNLEQIYKADYDKQGDLVMAVQQIRYP